MIANVQGSVKDVAMSEDVMSAGEFASLIRESVLRAVRGGRVESRPVQQHHDDQIIVGNGVTAIVERVVVGVVKELLGRRALLSGPLRELSTRLNAARTDAGELNEMLAEIDSMMIQAATKPQAPKQIETLQVAESQPTKRIETLQVAAETQVSAPEPQRPQFVSKSPSTRPAPLLPVVNRQAFPVGQKKCAKCGVVLLESNRSQRSASYCSSCLQPAPAVSAPAVSAVSVQPQPDVKQAAPDDLEPILVNGVPITFSKRAQPGFVAFFREFVKELKAGPVCGRDAYAKAVARGFSANRGTFLVNIENLLGQLVKKDGVWSLPGWTGTS